MNILLTNDDGYNSQGILLLKELLEPYGTVVICAPSGPMSAKSVSITLGKGIKVEKVEKNVYKCDGTPADCVSFALNTMNEKFDLVVSGCNHGFNISYDTMYSGTIGAALEALRNHTPSIAVSVEHNFELVRNHFKEVFHYILKEKLLSEEYLLNINFPLGDEVKGMKIATLYYRNDQYYFIKKEDGYWAYRNTQTDFSDDKESDCYLVNHGYISITPLNKTYFSHEIYQKINNKNEK